MFDIIETLTYGYSFQQHRLQHFIAPSNISSMVFKTTGEEFFVIVGITGTFLHIHSL